MIPPCPGQPVPALESPFREDTVCNTQYKPPLAPLEADTSCPVTCYLGAETSPLLAPSSFKDKLQAKQNPWSDSGVAALACGWVTTSLEICKSTRDGQSIIWTHTSAVQTLKPAPFPQSSPDWMTAVQEPVYLRWISQMGSCHKQS